MKRIRRRKRRDGAVIRAYSYLFGLVVFIAMGVIVWYRFSLKPVNRHEKPPVIFVVSKGEATDLILGRLQAEELIKSASAAKIYLWMTGSQGSLQAGSFRLKQSMNLMEVVDQLKHGTLDVWVTVPEGWRAEQIVDELVKQGLFEESERDNWYDEFRNNEGELFPDSYLFAYDTSGEDIIGKMKENFEKKTLDLALSREDLILASLVEREARSENDRPMIARVLKNRLKIGMALQVDVTLQFAKANRKLKVKSEKLKVNGRNFIWWERVSSEDKNIESPYNTYKYSGLPPGPIANPGLAVIKSVLFPAKSNYLYYVSESNGTTHFAETLEEHNENVRRFLK